MYLQAETQEIINTLKAYDGLKDCAVIAGFPFVKKPTNTSRKVIAVSPAGISAVNSSLGKARLMGSCTVNADVYVPQKLGSPVLADTVDLVVNAVKRLKPSKIEVSGITSKDYLNCFEVKCSFTFSHEIKGESNGE